MEHMYMSLEESIAKKAKLEDYFSINELKGIVQDVFKGLNALESYSLCHLNVKPSNILFSTKDNIYKLSDYGIVSTDQKGK